MLAGASPCRVLDTLRITDNRMLKEKAILFRRINVILDVFSTGFSLLIAFWIRYSIQPVPYLSDLFSRYISILYVALPLWYVLFRLNGKYESHRTITTPKVLWIVTKSVTEGIALLILITYFMKVTSISRTFILLFGALNILILVLEQALLRQFLYNLRARGYNFRRVLIVGTGQEAVSITRQIREHAEWGLKIIGFLTQNREEVGRGLEGNEVVGTLGDLKEILVSRTVDEVHIALPLLDLNRVKQMLQTCEEQGIRTRVMMDLYSPAISKIHLEDFHGTPMLTFTSSPMETWEMFLKEVIDRAGSFVLLFLFFPLFFLFALLIKIDSRGPVFFVQERMGLHKRRFRMIKFRTMVDMAENMKPQLMERNALSGPAFKMRDDPRCTRVGRILRKLSLDELPQLFNVLKGEMSFIGPRPPVPEEVAQYKTWQHRRLSMKPGISGLWQVSGRNEVDFQTWMELDLAYIDNWSLKLDFQIFLKTFPAVLFGRGAF